MKSLSFKSQACSLSELRKYVLPQLQRNLRLLPTRAGIKGEMRALHDDEEMYVLHKRKFKCATVAVWKY